MSQRTTPETTSSGPPTGSRRMRVLAGLTAATVAATAGVLTAAPASAAVPVFPDNITIFPDRDFVSIDGFVGNAGKPITVEVVRGGTVIGRRRARRPAPTSSTRATPPSRSTTPAASAGVRAGASTRPRTSCPATRSS